MPKPSQASFVLLLDGNDRRVALISTTARRISWRNVDKMRAEMADDVRALVNKSKVTAKDISYIAVAQGKGSFSDSRSVSVIANLYHHLQSIPVYETDSFQDWKEWLASPEKLKRMDGELKPHYYAEPSITKAK